MDNKYNIWHYGRRGEGKMGREPRSIVKKMCKTAKTRKKNFSHYYRKYDRRVYKDRACYVHIIISIKSTIFTPTIFLHFVALQFQYIAR